MPGARPGDGDRLFLNNREGYRAWEFQYDNASGRQRTMGLGSWPGVSREQARALRDDAAALLRQGIDPIAARKNGKQAAREAATVTMTIAFEAYVTLKATGWASRKYPEQLRRKFKRHVAPVIGDMPVGAVGLADAERVMIPIWDKIRPTAERLRDHLEGVINWAVAKGHRAKDSNNPFEMRRLEFSLSQSEHESTSFAALPYTEAPGLLSELRETAGIKSLALQFILLTAVRSGDVCGGGRHKSQPMRWGDVDLDARVWTVPLTKTGLQHRVPLSDAALDVLAEMQKHRDPFSDFCFPGAVKATCISDSTLRYLLHDLGYKGKQTVHGCRSLFKTWAEETEATNDPRVVEACLAHSKKSDVEKAYHRADFFERRKPLMTAWADFLTGTAAAASLDDNVIALRA